MIPHILRKSGLSSQFRRNTHSFIDLASKHGGKSLIGAFPSFTGRFDEVLKDVHIDGMDHDEVRCSFEVTESKANGYGTLHGGFIATIVDVVGTLALVARDKDKAGVSLDLNVTYINSAKIGEKVNCIGSVLRIGNSYGFVNVDLVRESDGAMIATGRHTKAFQSTPYKDHKKH